MAEKGKYKTNPFKAREYFCEKLLEILDSGDIKKWESAWVRNKNILPPQNAISKREYKGFNLMQLWFAQSLLGYEDNRWCTFKQAKQKGWKIKADEKSTPIEFFSIRDNKTKELIDFFDKAKIVKEENLTREEEEERFSVIVKSYNVFNGEQIEGIPDYDHKIQYSRKLDNTKILEIRDSVLEGLKVGFTEKGNSAYYSPIDDEINMPKVDRFKSDEGYISTFLHEASHSTGHKKRLNRNTFSSFGSEKYALEELRAELSSVFLSIELGIPLIEEAFDNHQAYLKDWAEHIRNSKNGIFTAIKDAEKICDYVIEKGNLKDYIIEVNEGVKEYKVGKVVGTADELFDYVINDKITDTDHIREIADIVYNELKEENKEEAEKKSNLCHYKADILDYDGDYVSVAITKYNLLDENFETSTIETFDKDDKNKGLVIISSLSDTQDINVMIKIKDIREDDYSIPNKLSVYDKTYSIQDFMDMSQEEYEEEIKEMLEKAEQIDIFEEIIKNEGIELLEEDEEYKEIPSKHKQLSQEELVKNFEGLVRNLFYEKEVDEKRENGAFTNFFYRHTDARNWNETQYKDLKQMAGIELYKRMKSLNDRNRYVDYQALFDKTLKESLRNFFRKEHNILPSVYNFCSITNKFLKENGMEWKNLSPDTIKRAKLELKARIQYAKVKDLIEVNDKGFIVPKLANGYSESGLQKGTSNEDYGENFENIKDENLNADNGKSLVGKLDKVEDVFIELLFDSSKRIIAVCDNPAMALYFISRAENPRDFENAFGVESRKFTLAKSRFIEKMAKKYDEETLTKLLYGDKVDEEIIKQIPNPEKALQEYIDYCEENTISIDEKTLIPISKGSDFNIDF